MVQHGKHPLVCMVGAAEFVTESLSATGQSQLTCYFVCSDYRNVVESVAIKQDGVRPTYLQAVDGEDCVCGITSTHVMIWYHSVCDTITILFVVGLMPFPHC